MDSSTVFVRLCERFRQSFSLVFSANLTTLTPFRRGECKKANKGENNQRVDAKSSIARYLVSVFQKLFPTMPSSSSSQSPSNRTVNCSALDSFRNGKLVPIFSNEKFSDRVWHTELSQSEAPENVLRDRNRAASVEV